MTKIAELKKHLTNNREFRKEYEKADAEFAIIEAPPSEFFGDPWHSDKDGKGYFADHDPSLMRK